MTSPVTTALDRAHRRDTVWTTRCPMPTAIGLAQHVGWLGEASGRFGWDNAVLQDGPGHLARHHLDHELPGLFREGGSIPALAARAAGAPTRLLGLTWIDEGQAILVRPGSGIDSPAQLVGRRAALPVPGPQPGAGVMRAMALQGFRGALAPAGLGLDDLELVEVPDARDRHAGWRVNGPLTRPWTGIDALAAGTVDAVYVKGPAARGHARAAGVVVGIDLDAHPDRRTRVNNGTPRPLTVHGDLVADEPGLVVAVLVEVLRAADWAADHRRHTLELFAEDTGSPVADVAATLPGDGHRHLRPDLSPERLALLEQQKDFLLAQGFLAGDVDVHVWAAPDLLAAAAEILAEPRR